MGTAFEETKKAAVMNWIQAILNPETATVEIPIVWEDEQERYPRPKYAYLLLSILSDTPEGTIEKSLANSDGEITLTGYGILTVSIQSLGQDSNEYLTILLRESQKQVSHDALYQNGMGIRDIGAITPVPDIVDELFEPRWNMDVTFGYGWSSTDTPGYITNVEYSGDYSL